MREELWNQLILSDIQARYFGAMLERRVALVRNLSLAAAVISCSALVAAAARLSPEAVPLASAVGAVLAILATHLKTPPELVRIAVEWRQVEREADRLWFRLQAGEAVSRDELEVVRAHADNAARIHPECGTRQELVDQARDAALRFRGVEP